MFRILIASQNKSVLKNIGKDLNLEFQTEFANDLADCIQKLKNKRPDVLIVDIMLFGVNKNETDYRIELKKFWDIFPTLEIIAMSPNDTIRAAVKVVKVGAFDYLTYPVNIEELKIILDSIRLHIKMQAELDYLRKAFWKKDTTAYLNTQNARMKEVYEKVRMVSQTDSTVLITGETGTGKGILAKLIHENSRQREKQFVHVHCGTLPENLLESELFGHEKGAFTGAVRRRLGKFEIANGGTIFLDEIGTISSSLQIKLLNVLQEKCFHRVGGEQNIHVDVRVIAATNEDLLKLSQEGIFRKDLFYRLNVFPIEMPSLRERKEDIVPLLEIFLKQLNRRYAKNILRIHPVVLDALIAYNWPGNIRELENLIERAYIIESSYMLMPKSFPAELMTEQVKIFLSPIDPTLTLDEVRKRAIEKVEREYLVELLMTYKGKINKSAAAAGIGERQLHKLMVKHHLNKNNFKAYAIRENKPE